MVLFAAIFSAFGTSVTVQRQSLSQDAGGGSIVNFTTLADGALAAIGEAHVRVRDDYARRDAVVDTEILVSADYDLKLGDRIVAGADVYLVKGTRRYRARPGGETVCLVDCQRRKV